MEKGTFERSIKDAFDKAESTPSGSVWTGVELGLEKSLAGTMKKRLLYYKLLAAASLVLMLGVTGLYYLSINDRNTEPLAVGNTNKSIIEEPINQSTSSSLPDEKVTPEQRSNEKQNEFAQKVKNSS
jgi:hypothetical protein